MEIDKEARRHVDMMKTAYEFHKTSIARMKSFQNSYDGVINRAKWPTNSELPTYSDFAAVQGQLGPAMEYMFPDASFLRMFATEDGVPPENVRKSEWALWVTLMHKMKIPIAMFDSIKDSFEMSIGYGIVESVFVTPQVSTLKILGNASGREMEVGAAERTIRYTYLKNDCVLPYTSGTTFNGPRRTEWSGALRPFTESDFMGLYDDTNEGMEVPLIRGNAEEIIDKVRGLGGFKSSGSFKDLINGATRGSANLKEGQPTRIPVIQCFEDNKHTWIVSLGDYSEVIYQEENKFQTMRNPLIKLSSYPDGERWHPMSGAEARQKISLGKDMWVNFMFDTMTRAKNANLMYTPDAGDGKMPDISSGRPIKVARGRASDAAAYLTPPGIDQSIMAFGDVLDSVADDINGKKDLTDKNYARGGLGAVQELMASTTGRERLSHLLLELGGLTDVIEQTMAIMQQYATEDGQVFRAPTWDDESHDMITRAQTVTADDLRHSYALSTDLRSRTTMNAMDPNTRMQIWGLLKDDPRFIAPEVDKLFIPVDEIGLHRISRSAAQQEQISRQNRLLDVASRAGPAGPAAAGPAVPAQGPGVPA